MDGKKNHAEISKFSVRDADNYAVYEQELEMFVEAVDPLLGSVHKLSKSLDLPKTYFVLLKPV